MIRVRLPDVTKRDVALFLVTWLLVGFASGTATLLGPVRWLTDHGRAAGWTAQSENLSVLFVIACYVALSFVATLLLLGGKSRGRVARGLALGLATVAASAALWLWMTPSVVNGFLQVELFSVSKFTFGPYPDRERFEQLQADGYTAVISLLHPAVVPFEPRLLGKERALAEEFGLELIHAPMLPWLADNGESLDRIRQVAATGTGRYYVHCYLGRDRVGTVRALVQRLDSGGGLPAAATQIADLEERRAFKQGRFERGPIHKLDDGLYLGPFPTDEEFLSYVVSGAFQHVVSLLDPDNAEDHVWIKKEREVLQNHGVPFLLMPMPQDEFDTGAVMRSVRDVQALPRPVYVHGFRSDGPVSRTFLDAYRTGKPTIPAVLFAQGMSGGDVDIVGPEVVVGPRPAGAEFGTYLERRGIEAVLFVGPLDHPAAEHDRVTVQTETDMLWHQAAADAEDLLSVLAQGGPWYVYGPGLGRVQDQIEVRFGSKSRPVVAIAAPNLTTNPGS